MRKRRNKTWKAATVLLALSAGCEANRPRWAVYSAPATAPRQGAAAADATPTRPAGAKPPGAAEFAANPPDDSHHPEAAGNKPRGAAESIDPPTGRACRVHFRRDALGLSAPAPLAVGDDNLAGRAALMSGTIDQVTDAWLVLRSNGRKFWLPRSAILAVELIDEP